MGTEVRRQVLEGGASSPPASTPQSPLGRSASSPGKVILFGEHAINRGAAAIAAAVGIHARSRVEEGGASHELSGGGRRASTTAGEVLELTREVDARRRECDHEAIRRLAAADYFAPSKYILGRAFGEDLPAGLDIRWESDLPPSSGLGSGGAAFAALAAALRGLLREELQTPEALSELAHSGDVVAHGGIASALDTQTSLLGGVRFFDGPTSSRPVACPPGLRIVIGNTGVTAPTSEVNFRVRRWAAEHDGGAAVFREIGRLAVAGREAIERGDWPELGRLLDANGRTLAEIGVSTPETDRLVEAARAAGALGAKLSGSGGGGIIIALVSRETEGPVARAIAAAGGIPLAPEVGVPGGLEHTENREDA